MNLAQLRAICPLAPVEWLNALIVVAPKWEVTSPVRQAAFVGHLAHESVQFTKLEEALGYSAERLMQVWPKRFPTLEKAEPFEYNPEKLANSVYSDRLGNGPLASGDGFLYRGRGPIQLTGKANYVAASKAIGIDLVAAPWRLQDPMAGLNAAGWFWQAHGLNELADEGTDGLIRQIQLAMNELDDELTITQRINGAATGFGNRLMWITRARTVLIQGV